MIAKAQQECLVLRTEYVLEEGFDVTMMAMEELALTVAGIDDQPDREWKIGGPAKEAESLGNPVLEDLDLILIQVTNQLALTVANAEGNVDQIHIGPEMRSLSPERGGEKHDWQKMTVQAAMPCNTKSGAIEDLKRSST